MNCLIYTQGRASGKEKWDLWGPKVAYALKVTKEMEKRWKNIPSFHLICLEHVIDHLKRKEEALKRKEEDKRRRGN